MIIPNRKDGMTMREYWNLVITSYGGFKEDNVWYIPAFYKSNFYSKTEDEFTAYVLVLNSVRLQNKNQG